MVAAFAAILVTGIGVGQPAEAAVPRQVGSFAYTSTQPGAATGDVASFDFQNPEDPSLKPPAVVKMAIRGPDGAVVDTTVPPQCHASDAQLMVEGPAGCPADSKVGSGTVVTDSGGGGPFPRYSTATISDFNNQDEVIGVAVSNDLPAIKTVDHTKIADHTSTTTFPALTDLPPPDPVIAIKSLHFAFPPYVRAGHAYARTPPTCPAVGYWTFMVTFTYSDGVTESIVSHSPCQSPQRSPTRPAGTMVPATGPRHRSAKKGGRTHRRHRGRRSRRHNHHARRRDRDAA